MRLPLTSKPIVSPRELTDEPSRARPPSTLACSNKNNGPINDICGDFSMTLIDVIDTLVVMGNRSAFEEGLVQ